MRSGYQSCPSIFPRVLSFSGRPPVLRDWQCDFTSQTQCHSVEPGVSQKLGACPGRVRAPWPACLHLGSLCCALPWLSVCSNCYLQSRANGYRRPVQLGSEKVAGPQDVSPSSRVECCRVHGEHSRGGQCTRARGRPLCACTRVCVCVCENIIPFTCTVTLGMGLSSLRIRKCTLRVV